ncbi:unnamed protein product [Hydatigera taeniaeformis]|uniref:Uncharacterized protein n=1 Tax=Hydatigena taeniaeformis TaxID=6205 RepID=A0A0R3WI82_HYDTA|nr:unnamed protein product [Hydatigera taeniaeformis]
MGGQWRSDEARRGKNATLVVSVVYQQKEGGGGAGLIYSPVMRMLDGIIMPPILLSSPFPPFLLPRTTRASSLQSHIEDFQRSVVRAYMQVDGALAGHFPSNIVFCL